MFKRTFFIVMPAALALAFMASDLVAQHTQGFGFPSHGPSHATGLHSIGSGGLIHGMQTRYNKFKADYRLNQARASAWPLPFSCWDRENYYNIFNQQYSTGNQIAHTLTAEYFDPETNQLNRAGELRVAWIMQNSARQDKQIFVFEDQQGPTIDQRIDSINQFAGRYYAHLGNARVARSRLLPLQIPAIYQQGYNQAYADGQPAPIVPVDVGSSINQSVTQ